MWFNFNSIIIHLKTTSYFRIPTHRHHSILQLHNLIADFSQCLYKYLFVPLFIEMFYLNLSLMRCLVISFHKSSDKFRNQRNNIELACKLIFSLVSTTVSSIFNLCDFNTKFLKTSNNFKQLINLTQNSFWDIKDSKTHSVFYHNFCCSNSSPNYSPENNIRCNSACLSKQKHKFTTDLHSLGNFKLYLYSSAKFIPLASYKAYVTIAFWKKVITLFFILNSLYFFYPFVTFIWFKSKIEY